MGLTTGGMTIGGAISGAPMEPPIGSGAPMEPPIGSGAPMEPPYVVLMGGAMGIIGLAYPACTGAFVIIGPSTCCGYDGTWENDWYIGMGWENDETIGMGWLYDWTIGICWENDWTIGMGACIC